MFLATYLNHVLEMWQFYKIFLEFFWQFKNHWIFNNFSSKTLEQCEIVLFLKKIVEPRENHYILSNVKVQSSKPMLASYWVLTQLSSMSY
jgi:hypothetical protein